MSPIEKLTGTRKEATEVLYIKGEQVAIILRDEKSRHSVVYKIEELGSDELAALLDNVAKEAAAQATQS